MFQLTAASDTKLPKYCKSACKIANTMLGFVARNFEWKTSEGGELEEEEENKERKSEGDGGRGGKGGWKGVVLK